MLFFKGCELVYSNNSKRKRRIMVIMIKIFIKKNIIEFRNCTFGVIFRDFPSMNDNLFRLRFMLKSFKNSVLNPSGIE